MNAVLTHLKRVDARLASKELLRPFGRVVRISGPLIESVGPPASIGDICPIGDPTGRASILAEVVGFRGPKLLLMSYGYSSGLRAGDPVYSTGEALQIQVGPGLLGRVVDGLGQPLDDLGPLEQVHEIGIDALPPNPLRRPRISTPMVTGVRAIDGFLTLGSGQRVGIFAGSGVGKSVLLGQLAKHTEADVVVVGLIGERGREVREFLEREIDENVRRRTVVVVATSDQPALKRVKSAFVATRIAESFRDQGKNVLLLMDSLTRVAMAQREIGLVAGEPPTSRGYTPSVFTLLPAMLERAGRAELGSITGLYTVLVEGDDMNDPIADAARSFLDGHIVLSRKLAHRNHYPAIDVLQSVSRLIRDVTSEAHRDVQSHLRDSLAAHREVEDLLQLGAYVGGNDSRTDAAIARQPQVEAFLRQRPEEGSGLPETIAWLERLMDANPAQGDEPE